MVGGTDGFQSHPAPFTEMPIDYAHAYGGAGYKTNPVGKGCKTDELPNVEDPLDLVSSRSDRPTKPAGFGPLNPAWPPRNSLVGKRYGKDYQKKRAPFYAEDFDWRFFHDAPADQQLEGYLRGDEPLVWHNLHPEHAVLSTELPGLRIRVFVKDGTERVREWPMQLDTVYADLHDNTVRLTWRGLDEVKEDDLTDVQTLLVAAEPLSEPRVDAYYHEQLAAFEKDPLGWDQSGADELSDQADAALADLDKTQDALDSLGAKGDDELGNDVVRLLEAANTPAPGEDIGEGIGKTVEAHQKRNPNGPSLADKLKKAMAASQGQAVPAPIVIPEPGKPLPIPPDAQRDAALTEALEQMASAQKQLDEACGKLEREPLKVGEGLTELLADPRFERLKPLPPVEPGPQRDLSKRDWRERDLRGADLRDSDLSETILAGADLREAQLAGADLRHAVLSNADLRGADLSNTKLKLANFTAAQAEGVILRGAQFDTTFFDQAQLKGADLSASTGTIPLFFETELSEAKVHGARWYKALLDKAVLERADFTDAELDTCFFRECQLTEAIFSGALLTKTGFNGSQVEKANFADARGQGVIFLQSTLDGSSFRRAIIPDSHFSEASAQEVDFYGAHLKEVRFYRTALNRACFDDANLFNADLRKAELMSVSFARANLYLAVFLGSFGKDCDFTDANLTKCRLPQ